MISSVADAATIPFQSQPDDRNRRMCGAAALVMVLRGLGREATLDRVWSQVADRDPYGSLAARSYRMAAFAKQLGLQAVVLQACPERAWQAIARCWQLGLSVILNHRIEATRSEGHFTVLVDQCDDHLILHDPLRGPHQRIEREAFLELWVPRGRCEISGHVLIAMDKPKQAPGGGFVTKPDGGCHRCRRPFRCSPNRLFSADDWLDRPLWQRFFCLHCDASFTPAQ